MKGSLLLFSFLSVFCTLLSAGSYRITFSKNNFNEKQKIPNNWELRRKFATPTPVYEAVTLPGSKTQVLRITSDCASGGMLYEVPPGTLEKYPVMRWKWRVLELPAGADGRDRRRDDQIIALYIGSGQLLATKSIAFRWETETPKGYRGHKTYAAGIADVTWIALRNKTDRIGEWYVEEFDVKKILDVMFQGKRPERVILSLCTNTQYTKSNCRAELEYIEFVEKTSSVKQ